MSKSGECLGGEKRHGFVDRCLFSCVVVLCGLMGTCFSATPSSKDIEITTQNLSACHHTHFECKNSHCIQQHLTCNGIDDCGDNSDEESCLSLTNAATSTSCLHDEHFCNDPPLCLTVDELCGEFNKCKDYALVNKYCPTVCSSRQFKCLNASHCILKKYVCNGRKDCEDGSDELNCEDIKDCREDADSFLCDDNDCIFAEHVCDGAHDCEDGSDERNNCYEQCKKADCGENSFCQPEGNGVQCYCFDGFEQDEDGMCKEKRDCDVPDSQRACSQTCQEGQYGPSCGCYRGYKMHSNGHYCIATGGEAVAYLATRTEIHAWTLSSKKHTTLLSGLNGIAAIAIDSANKRIFWAEQGDDQAEVFSMNLETKNKSVIYSHGLQVPVGLAYDFIANNLYVVDSGVPAILACGLEYSYCVPVFNDSIKAPKDIVLNPEQGLLYYTELGSDGSIMKASMDGSMMEKLVSTHNPYSLEIDFTTRRLYWLDGMYHKLSKVDFDGKNKGIVHSMRIKSPRLISTFEDYIYWVSADSYDVMSINKFSGHEMKTVFTNSNRPTAFAIGQESLQHNGGVNRCSISRCQVCLLNSRGTGTCRCPQGQRVSHSKQFCESPPGVNDPFLFASDKTRLVRINLKTSVRPVPSFIQTDSMNNIVFLKYLAKSQMIVYSDFDNVHKSACIAMVGLDKFKRSTPIISNLTSVASLAVDEASKIIFWTDYKSIHVGSMDGRYQAKLPIEANCPHGLAIQPVTGILFYSECATQRTSSVIKRCQLDGTSCHTLVNKDILDPNYMTVHIHHLYWSDPELGTISYCNQWGDDRHSVVVTSGKPLSFAIHVETLYWSEEGDSNIFYKHIGSNNPRSKISLAGNELTGLIVAFPQISQNSTISACNDYQNGGCDHICVSINKQTDRTCLCSNGYRLDPDGMKCVKIAADECKGFLCKEENICIAGERKCDAFPDCRDYSDESDCVKTCPPKDFQCNDGQCVSHADRCDGMFDCNDHSDENLDVCPKTCDAFSHRCDDGKCISKTDVCDAISDCYDGTDEKNCALCRSDQYECKNGDCIPHDWACDGDDDCHDNSDEDCQITPKECGNVEFRCNNGDCIDKSEVCDNIENCDNGEDEKNCTSKCPPGYFRCNNGLCIVSRKRCDGSRDCKFSEDERDCDIKCSSNQFQCVNGSCIGMGKRCNGIIDCADLSDEKNCPTNPINVTAKPCNGFRCGIGTCIDIKKRCDGKSDCRDNMDELNCRETCETDKRCSQLCVNIFSGIECRCHPGYELAVDGFTCLDINECADNNAGCSQHCINIKEMRNGERGFKCYCNDDYILGKDLYSCKAVGPRPELYVSTQTGIKKISVEGRVVETTAVSLQYAPTKIDGNIRKEIIYWVEAQPYPFDVENNLWSEGRFVLPKVIFKGFITDIAVDWVTGNVYVMRKINEKEMAVSVVTESGLNSTILTDQFSESNIVLHPKRGLLFWISSEKVESFLKQATMNGRTKRILPVASCHMNSDIKILSIDEATDRLYWIDPIFGQLKSVSIDDNDVYTFDLSTNGRHIRAMDVFESTAYLLSADSAIQKYVIYGNRRQRVSTISRVSYPEDIKVRHQLKQPDVTNRCQKLNCMYMCLLTENGAECRCPEGYEDHSNPFCRGLRTRITFSHKTALTTPTTTYRPKATPPVPAPEPITLSKQEEPPSHGFHPGRHFNWPFKPRVTPKSESIIKQQTQTTQKSKQVPEVVIQTAEENQTGNKQDVVKSDANLKLDRTTMLAITSECGTGCLNGGACVMTNNVKYCRCPQDFIGKHCEKHREAAANKKQDDETTSIGLVVGVIIAVAVVIFVVIAGVCYYRYKKQGNSLASSIRFQKQKHFVICNQEDKDVLVPQISFGNPGFQEEIDEEAHMHENQDWWKKLISRSRRSVDSAFHSKNGSDEGIDGFSKDNFHDSGISDKVRLL